MKKKTIIVADERQKRKNAESKLTELDSKDKKKE